MLAWRTHAAAPGQRISAESLRMNLLDILKSRRSVPSRQLGEPGPSPAQLDELIAAAIRVPDHGKMTPWRLLLVRGDARARLGAALAEIHQRHDPAAPDAVIAKD